ncbi:hypothetical protein [Tunicatimonas pelagia]|uniref:hypothetical protein n=1 Tax=Tunicatimonas pelagia TaxID=931531 RepID=UPI0026669400|nr:hypothetical protein [Tunicatimonas pelagia]WKN44225.1 hypothetical protein P0M28_04490 [Tunicatimonas pelagia]
MRTIFFIAICFFSCQDSRQAGEGKHSRGNQDTVSVSQLEPQRTSRVVSVIDTIDFESLQVSDTIYDDKFSIAPLGLNTKPRTAIPYQDIVTSSFRLDSLFMKSSIDPEVEHKIIRLYTDQSLLIFLRGLSGKIVLDRGVIFDSSVKLANGIHVGISKAEYLAAMNRESKKGNVILVKDQDQVYEHLFYFESDTLAAIELKSVLGY